MTEEGSVEQISAEVKALVEKKRPPARLRANIVTIGRLLAAEAAHQQEHGGEKVLHGVPLVASEDVPESEVQVLDADGNVVRTLRIPPA